MKPRKKLVLVQEPFAASGPLSGSGHLGFKNGEREEEDEEGEKEKADKEEREMKRKDYDTE